MRVIKGAEMGRTTTGTSWCMSVDLMAVEGRYLLPLNVG